MNSTRIRIWIFTIQQIYRIQILGLVRMKQKEIYSDIRRRVCWYLVGSIGSSVLPNRMLLLQVKYDNGIHNDRPTDHKSHILNA